MRDGGPPFSTTLHFGTDQMKSTPPKNSSNCLIIFDDRIWLTTTCKRGEIYVETLFFYFLSQTLRLAHDTRKAFIDDVDVGQRTNSNSLRQHLLSNTSWNLDELRSSWVCFHGTESACKFCPIYIRNNGQQRKRTSYHSAWCMKRCICLALYLSPEFGKKLAHRKQKQPYITKTPIRTADLKEKESSWSIIIVCDHKTWKCKIYVNSQ